MLSTYTRVELRDIILDHIRGRVTGANVARGSDYRALATAIATVVHGDQAAAQYLVEQILPSTAERTFLELHAFMRGLERFPAAPSRGLVRVDASAADVSIVAGAKLTHASGATFTAAQGEWTRVAFWNGRTVAPGSLRGCLTVSPNAAASATNGTPAVRDLFSVDVGGSLQIAAIKRLVPANRPLLVELFVPLPDVPASGVDLTPVFGCIVEVVADADGADGNLEPGDELTLDDPPEDASATAVVLEMGGGGAAETDEELRARVLDFMAERPGSGNRSDYRQWSRETPGVRLADAFVYPAYRGPGTIDVVPFGVAGYRKIGEVARGLVQTHLDEQASFQDDILVRELVDAPSSVAIEVEVTPSPGYEEDYEGLLQVVLADSTVDAVAVTGSATILARITNGSRVLVQTPTIEPRLFQRTVVGRLAGPGALALVLDEPLPELPTDGADIGPGGPLAQPAIDAIVAVIDAQGPGDTTPATRFPEGRAAHPVDISRSRLTEALMAVEGVASVSVTAPATDFSPATLTRARPSTIKVLFIDDSV